MDYEKKYKEAIERMKSWARGEHPECFSEAQKAAEFVFPELKESKDERVKKRILLSLEKDLMATKNSGCDTQDLEQCIAWLEKQVNSNKGYHRVSSTTLKRLYMNEAKYELLKSDIMEGIVGDFEKGTTHSYLTIKIPMLLCPSNCAKGDKVKLIIVREE